MAFLGRFVLDTSLDVFRCDADIVDIRHGLLMALAVEAH